MRNIQNSNSGQSNKKDTQSVLLYMSSLGIVMLGVAYAGVPLYRIFCQQMGLGGVYVQEINEKKVATMKPVEDRVIKVRFEADASSRLQWNFRPLQAEVNVKPGETALAFFTARNSTDKPVVGISTYNIIPYEAGPYFNKIQCFCFEDQLLNPKEQVDLPVFFYIDPEMADDPSLENVDEILLSYIFYPSKQGFQVPAPNFLQPKNATVT
ncbi:hypothetical protein LOTGIDRAFT_155552 [Lottia gigantea]|uniref:Cytochrome c oxidase assembly protein COX11, mitochondrial n=1 Tax=Lottia gigantea TaxID=225164 RepID=V3ZTH7_LOTGI|nr:hypothetical protein LOTGIDRAFT_155552 [Lottia gigantea]ESO84221.1 hypothetical protein LOTGIDRAFT_155552 [Lottia gigantea]